MPMIEVATLWDRHKQSPWDCGEGMIWPEDFVTGEWDRSNDAEADQNYLNAATTHHDTIMWWVTQYSLFKGLEAEIPDTIELCNGELHDGFHRLTAAVIVGLTHLPYREVDWR